MASWNSSNGAWLVGVWDTPDIIVSTLDFMRDHNIEYNFPTTLTLDANGKFAVSGNFMIYLHQYMKTLQEYEESPRSQGKKFKFFPVIDACFKPGNSDQYLDLSNDEVRATAVNSIQKFIRPDVDGSYITGMPRGFEGVQFNLGTSSEYGLPKGNTYDFEIIRKFMREVKAAIGPNKLTCLATPQFGDAWDSFRFHGAALDVDILAPMCFNSTYQTPEEYQAFMKGQVHDILYAVSGKYAGNQERPRNGGKVLLGFPCFSAWEINPHNETAENITTAAKSAVEGINKMIEVKDDALDFLIGASLYSYTDGEGQSGFSKKADMIAFKELWVSVTPAPVPTKSGDTGKINPTIDDPSNSPVVRAAVVAILAVCALLVAIG
ncbi:hypothetical protein TWF281_009601 [Arthrobotrys megalospora]